MTAPSLGAALLAPPALLSACLGGSEVVSAVNRGDPEAVRLALQQPFAHPDEREFGHGVTPLTLAVQRGNLEIVEILLDAGADPNKGNGHWWIWDGTPPLCFAGLGHHQEIFELLLARGANPRGRDDVKRTVLMCTAMGGEPWMVERLLELGAEVDRRDEQRQTALHHAAMGKPLDEERRAANARVLLAAGADPDAKDKHGRTPLERAVFGGKLPLVRALLAAGATPDGLLQAAIDDELEIARLLLEAGADPYAGLEGYKPIQRAASHEMLDLLRRYARPAPRTP